MPQDKAENAGPRWEAILNGHAAGFGYDRVRDLLKGASELYGFALACYLGAEGWGLRRRTILPVPVISIGNLSVGGTGKTPMTQYVARMLSAEGWHPAILSRGYRGTFHGTNSMVSDLDGKILMTAQEAGDEPYVLAKSLPGVPVIVGKDRRVSGRMAIKAFKSDVILLDDGFQYWQLERDLDIVLLDSRHPFENGYALPRGLLREPKRNLSRAGVVVLTRAQDLNDHEWAERLARVRKIAPAARIFRARHSAGRLRPLNTAAVGERPQAAVALCGIARPESFLDTLREVGLKVVGEPITYLDHQDYGTPQIRAILGKIQDYPDASLVTTEKDAAKLDADSFPVPCYALDVRIDVEDHATFDERIRQALVRSSASGAEHRMHD